MLLTSVEGAALATIALPAAAALVAYLLDRVSRRVRDWVVVLALAANALLALRVALAGAGRHAVTLLDPAAGAAPFGLSLAVDGLAGAALVVVSLVFLAVAAFSTGYVQPSRFVGGYFALLLLAAGALNAVLLAGDLVALSAALALLGVILAGLVGLGFDRDAAGAATKVLVMLEASAVLAASAAWLVLARGGSVQLDGVLARDAAGSGALSTTAGLLLLALAVAGGLAPLHTWLTTGSRHALPTVAALLAGALVPAGVYLSLRVLTPAPGALPVLALLGALSIAVGALGGLRTPEFLPALAFQAVGQAGLAAVALAEGPGATGVAAYQLAVAALFLPALTMGVGAVLQAVKGDALADFWRQRAVQPGAAGAALVAGAALAGLPPFPGYWSRLALVEALLRPGPYHLPLLLVVLLGSVLLTTALLRLVRPGEAPSVPLPPRRRSAVVASLVGLCAIGSLLAFYPPGLGPLAGVAPSPLGDIVAAALVLGCLSVGIGLRLGEMVLLPARLQAAFDEGTRWLAFGTLLLSRVRKRVRPEWLDVYAIVGGALSLLAWGAALVLDNTLGRLGRNY